MKKQLITFNYSVASMGSLTLVSIQNNNFDINPLIFSIGQHLLLVLKSCQHRQKIQNHLLAIQDCISFIGFITPIEYPRMARIKKYRYDMVVEKGAKGMDKISYASGSPAKACEVR